MLTILLYAIIVFAVLYVSAGLGAAMDLSVDDEGVLDFNVLMTQFETVLTSTDTVGAHFTDFSSYSFKITLMVAFALGIYALMKYTSRKRLHRKGVEHGSARWANEKEEKFLADKPEKKGKKPIPEKPKSPFETDNNILLTQEVRMSLNTRQHRYSVTYSFSDVTYDAADAAEQERIFLAYGDLLNSFDTSDDIQITLHNNVINQKEFSSQILLKHAGDGFDEYRDEYNEMLLDKMQQGQNGITTKKYFTVTVTAATLELAQQKLAAKELYMRSCFQKIGSNIEKLKANERIRIIADIFRGVNQKIRPISSSEFLRGAEKSLCCPDYFEFKKDYFMYNDKFARMVYLKHLPSSLVDDMLKDLCETSLPIVVTVNIAPVEPSEANDGQRKQAVCIHAVLSDADRRLCAVRSAYHKGFPRKAQ